MTRPVEVLNPQRGMETILTRNAEDGGEVPRSQSKMVRSWLKQALSPDDYELTLDLPLNLSAELFPEVFGYGPNSENVVRFMQVLNKESLKAWNLPRHSSPGNKHKDDQILPGECLFIDEMVELYCPAKEKRRSMSSMQMFMRIYASWADHISGMMMVHRNCANTVELVTGNVYDIPKSPTNQEALTGHRVLYCLAWAIASVGILPKFTPAGVLGRVWDKRIMTVVEKYEQS